jgi:predicted acetyltransferase
MIELLRAAPSQRSLLRQLYELYCHDFSPMTRADIGDDGYWTGDDFLDPWPDDLHIYLIRVDQQWAGFAWVAFGGYSDPSAANFLMDEFFVLRKYRRRGVGEWAAVWLFNHYPGTWEVGEVPVNVEAQQFWRTIISRYTGGHYREISVNNERWHGPVQIFSSQT